MSRIAFYRAQARACALHARRHKYLMGDTRTASRWADKAWVSIKLMESEIDKAVKGRV